MITSERYEALVDEILNGHVEIIDRPIVPEKETVFNVFLNTRKIVVPSEFKQLAMKNEHNVETVWFALDRYFDGQDLSAEGKTWAVQFTNAKGQESAVPISAMKIEEDTDLDEKNPTLYLGWTITNDITKEAGTVVFSLRCFSLNENKKIIYDLLTDDVTATIGDTLYVSEINNEVINPPADTLTDLVNKIDALLSEGGELAISYGDIEPNSLPTIDNKRVKGDMTSADFENIDYEKIKNAPKYTINGKPLVGGEDLELLATADEELKIDSFNPIANSPVAIRFNELSDAINEINEKLEGLTYIPMSIKSFMVEPKYIVKNSSYNGDIVFSWQIDGNVQNIEITDDKTQGSLGKIEVATESSYTATVSELTDSNSYTLTASGKEVKTAQATIDFVYEVFHGTSTIPAAYDDNFLATLTNKLSKDGIMTITEDATGQDTYIYYCVPTEYGISSFTTGGFTGGFTVVAEINHNQTEYSIWQSDNANLGKNTITIA